MPETPLLFPDLGHGIVLQVDLQAMFGIPTALPREHKKRLTILFRNCDARIAEEVPDIRWRVYIGHKGIFDPLAPAIRRGSLLIVVKERLLDRSKHLFFRLQKG